MTLQFLVAGPPQPKGSTRSFAVVKPGQPLRTKTIGDNPRTKGWQTLVGLSARVAARNAYGQRASVPPWTFPIDLRVQFYMARPGRMARRLNPGPPTTKPDLDKLLRAVCDALTGVLWVDDGQVVAVTTSKRYCDIGQAPGALVTVMWLSDRESQGGANG